MALAGRTVRAGMSMFVAPLFASAGGRRCVASSSSRCCADPGASDTSGTPAPAIELRVQRLSEAASVPRRGSAGAAGYDLFSAEGVVVPPGEHRLVKTDVAVAVPLGCYGRIAPRSGLALNYGIHVGAGVIDPDYRGNVGIILFNHSAASFQVEPGQRVAQLILERYAVAEVTEVDDLDATDRADAGFGSTGSS